MWIWLSIITMLSSAGYILIARYLVKQGMPVPIFCFWVVVFLAPMYGVFANKEIYKLSNKEFLLILAVAVFGFFLNITDNYAGKLAPNPAYPIAIKSMSVIIVCFASKYLLNAELTTRGLMGVALTVIGLTLFIGGEK